MTTKTKTNSKKSNENSYTLTYIPIGQIDLNDESRLREKDDPEIVEAYTEVLRQNMENGEFKKYPFPACGVYRTPDGRYVLTSGRHRTLALRNTTTLDVPCYVYPNETEAVWHGLGDNRKNGLRNSPGDLKKMILIALQKYDKSHRAIAEHIGCSSSYVDQVAKDYEDQLPTSGQLPTTRTGLDGKQYPARKPKKDKEPKQGEPSTDQEDSPPPPSEPHQEAATATPKTDKETKQESEDTKASRESNDVAERESENERADNPDTDLIGGQEPKGKPLSALSGSKQSRGESQQAAVSGAIASTAKADSSDIHIDNSTVILSSSGLPSLSDKAFAEKFGKWIEHLPIDDERRLALFFELIKKFLNGFKKREYCSQLKQVVGEYTAPPACLDQ